MIFFLHGPDSFRRRQKLNELKDKFMTALDPLGQSLLHLDGAKSSIKELSDHLSSGSLFTKKRMLIIENIFQNKQDDIFPALLKICQKNNNADDNALIFIEEEIKKSSLKTEAKKFATWLLKQPYVQEFKTLNNLQLSNFAKEKIKAKNSQISPSALSLLISKTGNDLWRLNNEIEKLSAASKNQIIDNSLVESLIHGEMEENIFALIDALVAKNNNLALRLLEEQILAGLSQDYILAMLQRQIKILLIIKTLQTKDKLSEKELVTNLKLHPFVIKKSLEQSKKFSLPELHDYWQELLRIDLGNKRGKIDVKSELYALLIKP